MGKGGVSILFLCLSHFDIDAVCLIDNVAEAKYGTQASFAVSLPCLC